MRTHQVLVLVACLSLAAQQIDAVVNSGANTKDSISASTETNSEINKDITAEVTDSTPAETEQEADKREAVIDLTGIYGTPIDTYLPPGGIGGVGGLGGVGGIGDSLIGGVDASLPIPVYGVPNFGQNIIYPAPPPDVPPPLPAQYGVPNPPPKISFAPKYKLPRIKYGPPFRQHFPKPIYGPPRKPYFPKPVYGPPKPHYGPPKPHLSKIISKPIYIPTIPDAPILNPPPVNYGPPSIQPIKQYGPPPVIHAHPQHVVHGPPQHVVHGPPQPVIHGPPPGVPAPPTPPDIKYDGWQPISGLVSKPLHDTYGPPKDSYGPPNDSYGPPKNTYGPPSNNYNPPSNNYGPPSNSYGLPTNSYGSPQPTDATINSDFTPPQEGTVGIDSLGLQDHYKSAGVVSDSYGAPLNSVTGSGGVVQISGEAHHQQSHQNHQEINQNQQNYHQDLSVIGLGGDNALSVVKSVGYELQGFDTYNPQSSYSSSKGYKFTQSNDYNNVNSAFGVQHFSKDIGLIPPSGVYGVTPSNQYGTPLFQPANNFKASLKRPVVFRDSISSGHAQTSGFITPPLPDINQNLKPVKEEINEPSDLYSLPHIDRPVSFQNLVHGSSTAGLTSEINFNAVDSQQGSYALPLQSNGYDFNTVGYSNGYHHDCNSHGSQPIPPQFNYGIPTGDLSGSHSLKVAASSNSISEAAQDVYAKSFAGSLGGGELVKSESIDLNNIPLQGALGSYTLQIQSADALGGADSSSPGIPHEQVLNDGLLQSILAAIEQQPQHVSQQHISQQQSQEFASQEFGSHEHLSLPIEVNSRSDTESQGSVKNTVVALPEESKNGSKGSGEKVDDNDVAIYLKSDDSEMKKSDTESYVSVKTADTNYKYDLKTPSKDETSERSV
ncbi:uncharacterized protein [Onthophagus taurus]|uniref:uncharacterized protein n=1 Tax=Onthophagus taurus TaxID=166361 RepID=UPI0039BE0C7B